ncbi:hypothetical protein CQW23_23721 [Capsicum baccatum]|uniref:Uncharacterized protein n=1 Tax=Capsicum baccatum TaxID=33114 RepID=A0A2G2VSR7_CAPBA|nr:hypothetical protein CQW23_23721 [Capsicum baccatum]
MSPPYQARTKSFVGSEVVEHGLEEVFSSNMICENLEWIVVVLSGKSLCNYLEALPHEWILEVLMEALREKGVCLSPTVYEVGYWVKFKGSIITPSYGWQDGEPLEEALRARAVGATTSELPETIKEFFTPATTFVEASVQPDATVDTLLADDTAAQSVTHDTNA